MKKAILYTFLILSFSRVLYSQHVLKGSIVNSQNLPVPGATLKILPPGDISISDEKGQFIFKPVLPGAYKLQASAEGYEKYSVEIDADSATVIRIRLEDVENSITLREIPVTSTRSGENAGMARTFIQKAEIEKLNTGQDLPYLLQLTPSAVITSDAGNGIGYTGIRIRGSDPARINVTVNGIPLNDAESQLVYWVNMPDFASSVENIEITRGAGSSTNGAGAFGASVNIMTQQLKNTAYSTFTSGVGSFNTLKNNFGFGTGLLGERFIFEGRLSRIVSDGYVDRATSDLKSFYLSGMYRGNKSTLRINVFSGRENTYQSWYGVPESRINGDLQEMIAYSVRNGLSEIETNNLINSGRTYNFYTYDNQVDNYGQDHYQFLYSREVANGHLLQVALHGTKGGGYYEEYKNDQTLYDYGILPAIFENDTISSSDLIRRRWLDNWFYGTTFSLQGNLNYKMKYTWGGALNRYDGNHFGEVIWARVAGSSEIRQRYYNNSAIKDDYNTYFKAEYSLDKHWIFYGDLQYRRVNYNFAGPDEDGTPAPQNVSLNFFNPKAGITYAFSKNLKTYASFAVARKEPNRNDYTETSVASRPKPELMHDWEAGIDLQNDKLTGGINFYYMNYFDQLVLTGQVNDVGSYTRTNIDRSYRTGVEIQAVVKLNKKFALGSNLTLSENRILSYSEFTDVYDSNYTYVGQEAISYANSPIAFSPAVTSTAQLIYTPSSNTECRLIGRFVSEQFMDNTGNRKSMLPSYSVLDLRASWSPEIRGMKRVRFDLYLNNLLDALYSSNGYTFGYRVDTNSIRENFYYPQAGFNFMGQITVDF